MFSGEVVVIRDEDVTGMTMGPVSRGSVCGIGRKIRRREWYVSLEGCSASMVLGKGLMLEYARDAWCSEW